MGPCFLADPMANRAKIHENLRAESPANQPPQNGKEEKVHSRSRCLWMHPAVAPSHVLLLLVFAVCSAAQRGFSPPRPPTATKHCPPCRALVSVVSAKRKEFTKEDQAAKGIGADLLGCKEDLPCYLLLSTMHPTSNLLPLWMNPHIVYARINSINIQRHTTAIQHTGAPKKSHHAYVGIIAAKKIQN